MNSSGAAVLCSPAHYHIWYKSGLSVWARTRRLSAMEKVSNRTALAGHNRWRTYGIWPEDKSRNSAASPRSVFSNMRFRRTCLGYALFFAVLIAVASLHATSPSVKPRSAGVFALYLPGWCVYVRVLLGIFYHTYLINDFHFVLIVCARVFVVVGD